MYEWTDTEVMPERTIYSLYLKKTQSISEENVCADNKFVLQCLSVYEFFGTVIVWLKTVVFHRSSFNLVTFLYSKILDHFQ